MNAPFDLGLLGRLWRLFDARERRRFVWLQILSLLVALSALLGVTAIFPFLGVLADPSLMDRNAWLVRAREWAGFPTHGQMLAGLGIAFVLLVCVANLINLLGNAAIRRFSHAVAARFQTALFDEYLRRDLQFHAANDASSLASRVVYHVDAVAIGLLQNALLLMSGAATCAVILVTVLVVDPPVALLAAAVFGGAYLLAYRVARRRLLDNGRMQSRRWNERARVLAEGFGAIREILLRRNQHFFREQFARPADDIARTAADTLNVAQLPRHLIECVAAGALVAAALWLGGEGQTRWLPELSFLALAAYRLLPALQQGYGALAKMRAEQAAFDAIETDLHRALAPRVQDPLSAAAHWRGRPRREISLQRVSFRYAADLPPAVHEVSLRIPAGARVGLRGANGSGKTTLADLIVGLLEPESGELYVDGELLDARNLPGWQTAVAYVPQTSFLQNASVAQNIALGIAVDRIDPARLRASAEAAQLLPFIESLPNGFDEPLGERGVRLSGGQRQMIGIARALYLDASLLVLDEATNALDPDNERRVLAALAGGARHRTLLIIAHHESALRHCDRVFELAAGTLVGGGPVSGRAVAHHNLDSG